MYSSFATYFFSILFGLCLGSFYNVCISRIPKDESLYKERSHCPHCGADIRNYDLIPVISYLLLKGKCRECKAKISIRYPLVEIFTAFIVAILFSFYGFTATFFASFIFSSILLIIAFIDLENFVIPDALILAGTIVGVLYHYFVNADLLFAVNGAAVGFLFMLTLGTGGSKFFKKEVLGDGDIKLAAMIGAYLGISKLFLSIFLASIIGLIVAVFLMLIKKIGRENYLPFGSFWSLGTFIALLYGTQLLKWFLDFQ